MLVCVEGRVLEGFSGLGLFGSCVFSLFIFYWYIFIVREVRKRGSMVILGRR